MLYPTLWNLGLRVYMEFQLSGNVETTALKHILLVPMSQ